MRTRTAFIQFALAHLALATAVARAQLAHEDIRLYFSTEGWTDARPHPQPAPAEALAERVPVTLGSRLYLWAQALNGSSGLVWNGIGLNLDLDGPARITARRLLTPQWQNPDGELVNRWTSAFLGQPAPPTPEINGMNMTAVGVNGEYGVRRRPRPDGFITDYVDGGHVLLGYFDFEYDGPEPATAWLEVGNAGIMRRVQGAQFRVYFGFGDDWIGGNDWGQRTALPDAYIVPEPGTAGMLLLAWLCAARRRSGCSRGLPARVGI